MFSSDKVKLKQNQNSVMNHRYRNQISAAITVQFIAFAHGIAVGWTSPTLRQLQSENSPTNFVITVEQVSWIGSLFGLGSLTGNIVFGLLLNRIGRKWCMYLLVLPNVIGWILIFFSKTYIYLYVARFLTGTTGGGMFVVVPIFISEIADPNIRGALSSMAMLFLSFGIMSGFVFSSHLDYYLNPCIIIIFPIIYLLAVAQFPETPQYLLRKHHEDKAHKAFMFYNNLPKYNSIESSLSEQEELTVNSQFELLKEGISLSNNKLEKLKFQDFVCGNSLKALFTAFVLMALNQFSGSFAFLNYMSEIFAQSGTDINPNTCSIIMGIAQIMGTFISVILVDNFGRKLLMLISSGGMAVSLFGLGLYIQFTTSALKLEYNWLPLVIMTFIILISSIGVTGLVFTIIVEILPAKIRSPAISMSMACMSFMVFVALKIFPLLLQTYGLAIVLFLCGGVSIIGWFYMLLFLKETKGKTLDNDRVITKRHNSSVLNRKYRNQLLATIAVQILTFAHGIAIGWTSPTLLKLQSSDSPTNFVVSVEQASWIGSLFGLGSLVGNLFGFLLNRIGRKWCLYLMSLPYIIAWILIFFSKTYLYLYVARFLIGITGGGIFLVIPIFISEIADASLRGTLSSLLMLFLSFGIMMGFVFSSLLDYYLNSCIIITFPILYLVVLTKFPETPQFLLRKQKIEKAHKAFKFYKNLTKSKNIEATKVEQQELNVDGEFQELKLNILTNNIEEKLSFKDFVSVEALKTFFTAFMLLALSQFSGCLAFLFYMSDIFAHAGTDIHPNTCTILTGIAQIIGAFSTVILVDRFGRKPLMLVSSGGMAAGLLAFGFYIQFTTAELKLTYNWFPIVIMTFVILLVNVAVTGLLIVEIFPSKIRAPATTVCCFATSLMIFAALKIFPLILQHYGLATLLYFCGGVSVIGGLYIFPQDVIAQRSSSVLNHRYRYQLLAAITIQMLTFAHGIATGWISPTLHILQSENSPTNFVVSVEQASWIGSLFGLGSLSGNIIFGLLLNRIGRKWCMYLIALPFVSAWILIYFSKTYIYLYVARFLSGMTGGGNYVVVPIFISEIADPSIRGALSSMAMLFLSFGIMTGFVFSSQLDYYLNPCIILIFPAIYLIAVTQFPETPQFLLRKQKIDKALESFKFYKNIPKQQNIEATTAKHQEVEENSEFEELKQNVLSSNGQTQKLEFKDFVCKDSLKAFFTAFMLMALNQFSGAFAFFNYMSDIFAQTGTDIHPNTCTIVMGVAQITGTCFTMILVDRFGRKMLMLVSSGGMAVGLIGFGFYIKYTSAELKLQYNWLPLVIMICIILIASIGVIALLFTVIVEILPTKIRAPATSMCMASLSSMVFVALKIFPVLMQNYGLATVLFSCGGVCVVGWFYLLFCLKETKGKSMDK
ncbi:putative facilitated trehalose transporter Tret1-2 [Lucilia cuprina]|uniref:Putative facilitated trehalose transporter Tret1-2 n=1 Tax=Lucilia cuprina TaxID=7375 RepID=A0A0L0CKL6_LUCCU|nr:putative facilitated trehalose transporter Tret1-2 [Lucilia cuprina]